MTVTMTKMTIDGRMNRGVNKVKVGGKYLVFRPFGISLATTFTSPIGLISLASDAILEYTYATQYTM